MAHKMEEQRLWRGLFGWNALFRWDVLGAIVPGIFIAVGLGMLGVDWFPHNLTISQFCFAIAALMVITKTIGHACTTKGKVLSKICFCVVLCGLTLAIALYTIQSIQSHKPKLLEATSHTAPEPKQEPPTSVPSTLNAVPKIISPIDHLTELGWTVTPTGKTEIEFSISSKPLPDMEQSARYLRLVDRPIRLRLQVVKSISGLAHLRGVHNLVSLTLHSIETHDLTEVKGLISLTRLEISQVLVSDLTPIIPLSELRELVLTNDSALRDLGPLAKLTAVTSLNLDQTPVSDLSPLKGMYSLASLDLMGTNVTDLTPLSGLEELTELTVDGRPLPGFQRLTGSNVTKLNIFEVRHAIDIGSLGNLLRLKSLEIMAPLNLNLSPMRKLEHLSRLQIVGTSTSFGDMNPILQLQDVEAIGKLYTLKALVLAHVPIADIGFSVGLSNLEELSIEWAPLADIRPIRSLQSLRKVDLIGIPLVDISPLLELPNLKEVQVQRTPARSDVITVLESRGVTVKR